VKGRFDIIDGTPINNESKARDAFKDFDAFEERHPQHRDARNTKSRGERSSSVRTPDS
jgi:hypothetical protein